jgi:pyruvate/2-oxoglutarate dehydrogenase complex dihydrolipoamide dehydrogenase (E3) component/uncharacterized membrane protein YdjX (TVP38/TMEM64 family)
MKLNAKWWILAALVVAVGLFQALGGSQYLTLEAIKNSQAALQSATAAQPLLAAAVYFVVYVLATALSLPGAAVLTLVGGVLFGLAWGLLIVSFASSLGATLAFLASRWLLRDTVQARFGDKLAALNEGVKKDGAFYLFGLRLVPLFPFFMINLAMGLTPIRPWTFYWVSQVGMLAGTAVYVNAGTQLAQINSLSGLASPSLIAAFALLGVFPLLARKLMDALQARKVYRGFTKPKTFDRNLVVIGGGAAGLATSYIAAAVKAKVTLVEKHKLGGDCLNTGCVPSNELIRSAKFVAQAKKSADWGIAHAQAEFDFAEVMGRVHRVIGQIEPHDSAERYRGLGVDVVQGAARIVSPWEVEITHDDGTVQRLTTRAIVIADGARPFVPPIPGLDQVEVLTSDSLWRLKTLPRRLLVLGGGPIGSELTQAFNRLGSQVTQVEMAPRLLAREDADVSEAVMQRFAQEGVDVRVGHAAKRVVVEGGEKFLVAEHQGQEVRIAFDQILVAVGRQANLQGYGLQELGVTTGRTVEVNGYLQTNFPNIYAADDVAGPYQWWRAWV